DSGASGPCERLVLVDCQFYRGSASHVRRNRHLRPPGQTRRAHNCTALVLALEPSRAGPCTFRDSACAYTAAAVITDTAVQIAVGSSWPRRRRTRQRQQLSHRGVLMDRMRVLAECLAGTRRLWRGQSPFPPDRVNAGRDCGVTAARHGIPRRDEEETRCRST